MKKTILTCLLSCFLLAPVYSQTADELDDLLTENTFAKSVFYSTRIVNSHSIEMVPKGVLEFRISHRFGQLSNGAYDLFGLDVATMRMGFDFGLTDNLSLGIGRSTIQKTYDGFAKYRILRQQTGKKNIPVGLAYVGGISLRTLDWADPRFDNYYTNRLSYVHQLLLARQFSKKTSVQLMPTLVHRNLVDSKAEKNDVISIGAAIHQQILPSLVVNMEYFYNLPNQIDEQYKNSLSMGFIFNTGWHSFSIHISNSRAMYERGYITETTNQWNKNQIHIGFNITREFHLLEDW